uniref:Putative secreted protein n=1 Tax=Amblyomma triste TaxID=251400 RepID=A0A023G163_AMBTT
MATCYLSKSLLGAAPMLDVVVAFVVTDPEKNRYDFQVQCTIALQSTIWFNLSHKYRQVGQAECERKVSRDMAVVDVQFHGGLSSGHSPGRPSSRSPVRLLWHTRADGQIHGRSDVLGAAGERSHRLTPGCYLPAWPCGTCTSTSTSTIVM